MNLLTIAQNASQTISINRPMSVAGSSNREMTEILTYLNEVGDDLARRVDWGQLTKIQTISGNDADTATQIAMDLLRVTRGVGVKSAAGTIVRPLGRAEWNNLPPQQGTPRYFLLEGGNISFWPQQPIGQSATVTYQSSHWCNNGSDEFKADTDEPLIPGELFEKGLIARWKRQKGLSYADFEGEYEAALVQYAQFNDRGRL